MSAGGGGAETEHGTHHGWEKELKQVLARVMALGHPKPCCQAAVGIGHGDRMVGSGELPPGSATRQVLFVGALLLTFKGEGLLGIELGFSSRWHDWLVRRLLWKTADSKPSGCFFLPPAAKGECFLVEKGQDSF